MDGSAFQQQEVKILMLEDNPNDVILIERIITKTLARYYLLVAKDGKEFELLLDQENPDLVLADYHIPGYSGADALNYTRSLKTNLPFVFVTGTLEDEELAAQTILNGASGFVLKNNLERLPRVIHNVMTVNERVLIRIAENKQQIEHNQYLINELKKRISSGEHADEDTMHMLQALEKNLQYSSKPENN